MKIDLEQLKEMQEVLFKQQCDLDIQKAMVKHFINKREAAISVTRCCTELKSKECPMCNEEKDCEGHNVCEDCGGRSF